VTIAGKEGLLITAKQTQQDVEFSKVMALFGDQTTTMVVGAYPTAIEAEVGEQVRASVLSARPLAGGANPEGRKLTSRISSSGQVRRCDWRIRPTT
jgi:hypothetical protein